MDSIKVEGEKKHMDYKIRPQDFSQEMIESLDLIRGLIPQQPWTITDYAIGRAKERGISYANVKYAVQHGRIVEYQYVKDSERLLVRDSYGTCISLDINNHVVITVYFNDPRDEHSTLDESNYIRGWQIKLLQAHYMMLQEEKENRV